MNRDPIIAIRQPLSGQAQPEPASGGPRNNRARTGWWLAALAILFVLTLGNIRLLTGNAVPRWDAMDVFEPSFALVGDAARAGHLVKWNPWSGAGSPDWTEPEFGTTSPVLLAASLLFKNPLHGYIAYWISVWTFGGLGMLLLAKHAGCSSTGGVIVACGFAASGFFTGHAEHMSSIYSVSFLPWILWRFDAGLLSRDWWHGVQAGVLYGLSALGGYPEFTILTPGFLFLWAIGRVAFRETAAPATAPGPSSAKAPARALATATVLLWVATAVVGALIFSLPYSGLILRTRGYTDYIGPRPRDVSISSNLLPAGALSTLASPYLANLNLTPAPIWPETDISMTSVYAGAASVVLAAFALRRRGWRWWVAAVGLFFLCCAVGSQLPIRGWLYDLAPPTRYFRNPALFRAYVILTIGFLAALGARDLTEASASQADRVRLWRAAVVAACCAAICFGVVSGIAGKSAPRLYFGVAHLGIVWFGLAALSLLLKTGRLATGRFLRLVAALACFDALGALYLAQPTVSDLSVSGVQAANAEHDASLDLTPAGLDRDPLPPASFGVAPNNRNILVKKAVLDDYTSHQILRNRFQEQIRMDPQLSRMATGRDRIWFSASVARGAPDDAGFALFQRRVHELDGQPVLILHSPEQMLALAREAATEPARLDVSPAPDLAPCIAATVTDLRYQTDQISFQYLAPSAGYLLLTDRWADGWEVTVNGQSRPVWGADFIYRAVAVEAGPNLVRFQYNPQGFQSLLAVNWGVLILAAAWQCRRLFRARSGTVGAKANLV